MSWVRADTGIVMVALGVMLSFLGAITSCEAKHRHRTQACIAACRSVDVRLRDGECQCITYTSKGVVNHE